MRVTGKINIVSIIDEQRFQCEKWCEDQAKSHCIWQFRRVIWFPKANLEEWSVLDQSHGTTEDGFTFSPNAITTDLVCRE